MKNVFGRAMLGLMSTVGAAQAALLVYDGVPVTGADPYLTTSNLGGQNPKHATIIGETNAWVNPTSALKPTAGGLTYPVAIGLSPQPGFVRLLQAATQGVDTRTSYRLLSASSQITQSYYMSVLGAYSSLPYYTNGLYGVMGLCGATSGNAIPNEGNAVYVGYIKRANGTVDAILKVNASIQVIQAAIPPGTNLFTVKFTYNPAGADTVSAAIATTPVEPASWAVSVTTNVIDSGTALKYVAVGGYWNTWNGIDFDEWRVGTTYADVAGLAGGGPSFTGLAGVQGVTTSGATLTATLGSAGSPLSALRAFWGETNGGEISGAWSNTASSGTATGDGQNLSFSAFSPALTENRFYYYRLTASNATGMAWALSNPAYFMTAPVTVTAPVSIPENSITPVSFTLQRPAVATALPLSVSYTVSGTAVPGVNILSNYTGVAQFAAAAATTTVAIQPLPDWSSSTERTVVVSLLPGAYVTSATNSASVTLTDAQLPVAPTNAWLGAVSTLASNPSNWALGVVPTTAHDVVVTQAYAQRNLDWDVSAPAAVGSWTQPLGCTNTVTFHTTPGSPLSVVRNVELLQGAWTQAGPSNAPAASVAVTVGGDFHLAAGATIDVSSKGWLNATGPGYVLGSGSSHAGEGWMGGVTYGSALNPVTYGSGARGTGGSNALLGYAGGGLVYLVVGGTAKLEGSIASNGYGVPNNLGGSSGGTLNLTAARFEGNGALTATGGTDTYAGPGAGGRIRLRLTAPGETFTSFTGTARAEGLDGDPARGTGASASGTVVWQTAADGLSGGLVVVDNLGTSRDATNGVVRATHLTPTSGPAEDLSRSDWVVRGNARLRVTADTRLQSLTLTKTLPTTSPRVFLEGRTVRVNALTVLGTTYAKGTYTAAGISGGVVLGAGQILVGDLATLIMVR